MKTVVGLLKNNMEARNAIEELVDSGFPRSAINIMASDETGREFSGAGGAEEPYFEPGTGYSVLSGGTSSLTRLGILEEDASFYAEEVNRGGLLVTVSADDAHAEKAADILRRHGAIDIDEEAGYGREEAWAASEPGLEESRLGRSTAVKDREGAIPEKRDARYGRRQDVAAMDDEEFLRHFNATYGNRGERFEETYRSAYHFAESESSAHPQLLNRDWPEVEEDIHRDWERSHPGTWTKVEEAIHFGWDRNRRH